MEDHLKKEVLDVYLHGQSAGRLYSDNTTLSFAYNPEYGSSHVHTNGVESFWSMLRRAHKGTFHKLSPKHLQRYVDEFAGRHNVRELDTFEQMAVVTEGLMGRYLPYQKLVRNTGLLAEAQG